MPLWNIMGARVQQFQVFHTILEVRSLTKAAEQLGMTQSAVSKQLKLLRQHFDDELFVRTADGMVPTSKAMSVVPHVQTILEAVNALEGETAFDPAELRDRFVISTTDEIQHFILPKLLSTFDREAPLASLAFKPLDQNLATRELETGTVHLLVTANWAVPDHFKMRPLYDEDFVCMFRAGHPLAGKPMTLPAYVQAAHMMVAPLTRKVGVVDKLLAQIGQKRFVRLSVPNFMQVGKILTNSDLIVTLPRKVADAIAQEHALVMSEVPLDIPKFSYFVFWHQRYDNDHAYAWLIDAICRDCSCAAT